MDFPIKRVKCYLIECAVSYQRELPQHRTQGKTSQFKGYLINFHVKEIKMLSKSSKEDITHFGVH